MLRSVTACGAPQQPHYPKKYDCSDNRSDEASDEPSGADTDQAEYPAAENPSDYTHNQIYKQPESATAHDFAGYESCYDPDDYIE